ncbi:hypothetical protein ASPWEDRAFT_26669 [Aspergillus wentii DTO 134E9]|uniref:Uncharacterized protein n=1 Tax=Aspergillus wentii DTO 134E9 TaxID=1073089 RepID=A0A1L9RQN4_ASPWE|nr:uncharacterized protein ASPWEDRAFT_26669 [Aspergillus wentii DTO 134E9]KAI9928252.1 hypothetical protein MW887_002285 [Aspergillus wentii]OJJ37265.1 hypothetical protein ASPWEDRAFT_26669 [Aspergillus wentii DTO 134E9]
MADSPKPPSRNHPPSSASTSLRYPTLPPLSASVEEWLSRSRPTSMTSEPHGDHPPPKSLGESWATLSVCDAHSEDGARSEQTDVGSLIDQTGPDDVASLDERFSSSEMDGNDDDDDDDDEEEEVYGGDIYEDRSSISESQELPARFPRLNNTIEDSGLTAKAFHHSTDSIEFAEPDLWPELERVELKHTIHVFGDDEASELKKGLPYNLQDSFLTATVQQTMTKESLGVDKPFRVLYIGNPEFRNIILDKIGDVLVSSSGSCSEPSSAESSRYHVVPTSFGAGAIPNYAELLPIHVQLIVDECLGAVSGPQADKPSTISLNFKNRPSCTSSWTGSDYFISSSSEWTLPDVAIVFVANTDDATATKTHRAARAFMERHGVPTMAISEKPLWKMTSDLIPVNPHSLHMCLESRHSETGETLVLRRYPIDLKTFESITPSQLNRNLASLASIYPKKSNKVTTESPKAFERKPFFDTEKYSTNMFTFSSSKNIHELTPALRIITLAIISAVAISLGHSALKALFVFISQFFARSAISTLSPPSSSSVSTSSIIPVEGLRQTSLSVRSAQAGGAQLAKHKSQSRLEELMDVALAAPAQQKPDQFEIRVVGDCHVVIKPPHGFPTGRRQPRFSVNVHRHDTVLAYELSRLFEGVYTLKLDREDAYGLINITITTDSKPFLSQVTPVDFGTPWLKIANWKRAAHAISAQFTRDLNIAQTGLSEVYGRICTDLQVLMGDVVKKSHFLRQEADLLRRDSVQQLSLGTREVVLSRSRQLSEAVKRTALQPFLTASSALQERTDRVNRDAKELVSGTWNRISSVSTQGVDLGAMMDHVRNARKCKTLDIAQTRARSLVWRKSCQEVECSVQSH